MKKILHLFRSSQFTEGFIKTINKYSTGYDHTFLVYGTAFLPDDLGYLYEKNVRYVAAMYRELRKPLLSEYFDSFDQIIYHGIFDSCILSFFFNSRILLPKLFLYFWGGDIPLLGTEEEKTIKKSVIHEAAGIIVIVESDYKKIVDIYQPCGKYFCMQYCSEQQLYFMKKYLSPHHREKKDEIFIQLGNSATKTNNHIEILKILEKFKNEKIRIYLPLAYGDIEYAKKVIEYGKQIFGDKIVVQTEMVTMEEFIKVLAKMDIGIFAMDRQQALGSIYMLAMNGSKLYVKWKSQLDNFLSDELKCQVSHVEDIISMDFEKFIAMPYDIQVNNAKHVLEINETEFKMEKWNNFFAV